MEVAFTWTDEPAEYIRTYANGIHTSSGGTHELGLKAGVVQAVRSYLESHDLQPKGVTLTAEDIREGSTAILSVYLLAAPVPGADEGAPEQPRDELARGERRRGEPRGLLQLQPHHGERRHRTGRARRAGASGLQGRRRRGDPEERRVAPAEPAREARGLREHAPRGQRALPRRGRLGRRHRQAGPRPAARRPSFRSAARSSTPSRRASRRSSRTRSSWTWCPPSGAAWGRTSTSRSSGTTR